MGNVARLNFGVRVLRYQLAEPKMSFVLCRNNGLKETIDRSGGDFDVLGYELR